MKTLPSYLMAFVAALAVSHSVYYFPLMPERMASHFNGSGAPNDWSSREAYFAIAAAVLALNLFIFLVIPWFSQKKRRIRLNIPNKSYWLSAERIDRFYLFFRTRMAWFGILNLIFGIAVMHSVFEANMVPERNLNNDLFLSILIGYLVFVVIWLISFFRKLRVGGR